MYPTSLVLLERQFFGTQWTEENIGFSYKLVDQFLHFTDTFIGLFMKC